MSKVDQVKGVDWFCHIVSDSMESFVSSVASLVFARKAELEWKKRQAGRRLLAASCWLFLSFHRLLLFLLFFFFLPERAREPQPAARLISPTRPHFHVVIAQSVGALSTHRSVSLSGYSAPPPCVRARDFPPLRPPPQRFRQSTVSGSCCCTCTTCGFIKFFFFVFQSFTSLEFVGLATDTNRCHSFGAWRFAASLRFSCLFFFIPSFQYMFPLIQRFQVENQFLFRTFNSTCVAEEGDARSFGPSNDGPPPQSDWERRRKGKICPKESKAHRRKFRWRRCRSTTC